jgi:hypothetical protein
MGFEKNSFRGGRIECGALMQDSPGAKPARQFMSVSGMPMTKAASYDIVTSRGA